MPNPYGWGQDEPQIKPKDQGGDTIATFAQKIYNLFDSLFNTLNSYPWSPATQNDAGYMSATDKTLVDTIPDLGTFSRMFFSQTSGNYKAPRTGVYKITIKGGGGGGGGGLTSNNYSIGGSGGEGLTLVFYKTLVANQTYPYVIGAGGAAGTSDASAPTGGGQGGTTNFNNEYSCGGGYGGNTAGNRAGYGANEFTVPTGAEYYVKYGINGFPGMMINVSGARIGQPPGAGSGGTQNSAGSAGGGGGGGGGSGQDKTARPGGNGFILIEYQG